MQLQIKIWLVFLKLSSFKFVTKCFHLRGGSIGKVKALYKSSTGLLTTEEKSCGFLALDIEMVLWYHGTMNTIATNLRFPVDEYRKIKLLALTEGKSTAALIRHAVLLYNSKKLTSSVQINLAEQFRKSAIKIDISVLDLIKSGRKFE